MSPARSLQELSRRLVMGPGMRAQRLVEALVLLAALVAQDVRLVYVVLGSAVLQSIEPRLAVIALPIAALDGPAERHRVGDLYFDLAGSRGSYAVSVVVMAVALASIHLGLAAIGWILLAAPTASLLLSSSAGFCAGCAIYVGIRDAIAGRRETDRTHDTRDVDVDTEEPSDHQH